MGCVSGRSRGPGGLLSDGVVCSTFEVPISALRLFTARSNVLMGSAVAFFSRKVTLLGSADHLYGVSGVLD